MSAMDVILCPPITDFPDGHPMPEASITHCVDCGLALYIAPSGIATGLSPICLQCAVPRVVENDDPVMLIKTNDAITLGIIEVLK